MSLPASNLEQIATRAMTLYSRPTVALDLMRLTEQPEVGGQALKECVSRDPALVSKILRVVNSSLYGLPRPVADLNQAINLLGIKPLKLLVLGFSLPDALFAEVAANELQWYWTNTLTRAVAARAIAEQLWRQPGDEAFTAGLLQDIGILVLLRELGEPYAKFLNGVIGEQRHLAALEQDTLGFDHVELSGALLARWGLPQRIVEAIALPKRTNRLERLNSPEGDLPQILHLAEMLMQVVGQRQFSVLKELMEAGKAYRGMTKSQLATLVEGLQLQVDQLGQVLSLELASERDYVRMLVEAHRLMSELSEQLGPGRSATANEDGSHRQLLTEARELSSAMQSFLGAAASADDLQRAGKRAGASTDKSVVHTGEAMLARSLSSAARSCRERRLELSLLIIEPAGHDHAEGGATDAARYAHEALSAVCQSHDAEQVSLFSLAGHRAAAILTDCDRRNAVSLAQDVNAEYERIQVAESDADIEVATTMSVGVATLVAVPKNFDPQRMIERAAGCLAAARQCGISTVKSIEV